VRRLTHADGFNTPFLELRFPANALTELAGTQLTQSDSVRVTVTPKSGMYGFTLTPNNMTFAGSNPPVATFFFGLYGDASVAETTPTYAGSADYVAALDVWEEVTIDLWRVVHGSAAAGVDVIAGSLESPGQFVLAAPR